MPITRRVLFAALPLLSLGAAALAQTPPQISRVRGTIESATADAFVVQTRTGDHVTLKLAPDVGYTWIEPIAIDAIKPGSFIGTAAVPGPDGTLKALEIQVFPEAMRGVGEGHRPWDLEPGSTMTNGTVGDLKVSNGRMLTLTYKGGEQKVFVPEKAPIITYEKTGHEALKPGAHVIVFVATAADGTKTATRVGVGKDGLVPPM